MIDYSRIYNRKKRIRKDGNALIQIRAYDSHIRKYKFLSTGIKVNPQQWDERNKKINRNHFKYVRLNRILDQQLSKLDDYEISIVEKGEICTLEMIEYYHKEGNHSITFNEFVDYELKHSTLKKSTIIQQTVFLNKINEFNSNISFAQIDFDLCCRFQKFLIEKGLNKNSIHKEFKNFKKFVNLAINKSQFDISKSPFPKFKIKTVPSKKVFLTEEEIVNIEELDLRKDEELETIRDIYLFGIYTGLRFSDVMNLKEEDLVKLEDGSWNLEVRMQKTDEPVLLPLHKLFDGRPKDLWNKHCRINQGNPKVFKNNTNQHVNRLLKVISRMAKINKRLTYHSSRHSFGTILLNKGIGIEVVQGLMGHRRLQQTQEYAKLLNTTVVMQLEKVWS